MDLSSINTDNYPGQADRDTASQLQVYPAAGLADREVDARLQRFGHNEMVAREESLWHCLLRGFCQLKSRRDALTAVVQDMPSRAFLSEGAAGRGGRQTWPQTQVKARLAVFLPGQVPAYFG